MLTSNEEIIANGERFAEWDNATSRSKDAMYKQHKVDVLEYWLEARIPGRGIGNLFRFNQVAEFEMEKDRIINLLEFDGVNNADQKGRPLAALNSYGKYLDSLQNEFSDVDASARKTRQCSNDINSTHNPLSKDSRRTVANDRVINCLDGLIELIIGANNQGLSEDEKLKCLVKHMIQKSYFFKPEHVCERHQEILCLIRNNDKMPVRYSTAAGAYTEEDRSVAALGRVAAIEASSQRNIFYNSYWEKSACYCRS